MCQIFVLFALMHKLHMQKKSILYQKIIIMFENLASHLGHEISCLLFSC